MKAIFMLNKSIVYSKARMAESSEASSSEKHVMHVIRNVTLDDSADSMVYALPIMMERNQIS